MFGSERALRRRRASVAFRIVSRMTSSLAGSPFLPSVIFTRREGFRNPSSYKTRAWI